MHIIYNFQKFKFAIIIKKSSAANPQQKGKWGSDWKNIISETIVPCGNYKCTIINVKTADHRDAERIAQKITSIDTCILINKCEAFQHNVNYCEIIMQMLHRHHEYAWIIWSVHHRTCFQSLYDIIM